MHGSHRRMQVRSGATPSPKVFGCRSSFVRVNKRHEEEMNLLNRSAYVALYVPGRGSQGTGLAMKFLNTLHLVFRHQPFCLLAKNSGVSRELGSGSGSVRFMADGNPINRRAVSPEATPFQSMMTRRDRDSLGHFSRGRYSVPRCLLFKIEGVLCGATLRRTNVALTLPKIHSSCKRGVETRNGEIV